MNEPAVNVERKNRINRLQVLHCLVFVLFAAIILRLAQLQIQQGDQYASELMTRSFKKDSIPAMRGNIYDRSGHVIAESRPSFVAVFREQEWMGKEAYISLIEKLEKILTGTDRATILKKMDVGYAYENGNYVRTARQLPKYVVKELKSDLTEKEIAELGEHRGELEGIEVEIRPIRQYDSNQIAVQAVGYVRPYHIAENLDIGTYRKEKDRYLPNQFVGLDGIELSYEAQLRGINGYRLYEVAADQTVVKQIEQVLPVRGNDLTLTIDQRVQLAIRDFIKQFLPDLRATIPEASYAKGAYVVAIEIKTGKVVAMVSYPEYDPNVWIDGPDQKMYDQIQFAVTNGTIREAPYDTRPLTGEAAIAENDMADFVEELQLDPRMEDVNITCSIAAREPLPVVADHEKLGRVFMNIIDNSLKYMDKAEKRIRLELTGDTGHVTVSIEDNGSGIEQKALAHIFDRFYRVDPARSTATGGSGLGLAIVKQIVEGHGGRVSATSEPGAGTRILITLPRQKAQGGELTSDTF